MEATTFEELPHKTDISILVLPIAKELNHIRVRGANAKLKLFLYLIVELIICDFTFVLIRNLLRRIALDNLDSVFCFALLVHTLKCLILELCEYSKCRLMANTDSSTDMQ